MAAQIITYDKLYSQPSLNIFSILDTRSNVADPRDATGARKFVYDSDPLMKSFDFSGLPYIICEYAEIDAPVHKSVDAKKQTLSWSQGIKVRTAKDGSSGSRTDTGITDMRQIVDSIIKTFNNSTIKSTLRGYDMYNVDCRIINIDSSVINQKQIHETTFELTYTTRLQVVA
jgi:hypothetical protein